MIFVLGNLSKIPIYRYGHALPWQLRGNFHTSAFCFSEEPAGVEKEEEEYHTIIKNTERAKGNLCDSDSSGILHVDIWHHLATLNSEKIIFFQA